MGDIPLKTVHLFPILDQHLLELLRSLSERDWHKQTVARLWTVKDVASHLLDGNLRGLSTSRDNYFAPGPNENMDYAQLVSYINELNMKWTNAAKRLSPQVLIELMEITGKLYSDHIHQLDPYANSVFPVSWAGQSTSSNWFHIAREYSEKFLHQQQIRDAVGIPGIMTRELFFPFIETFMQALPYTFRDVEAEEGTTVAVEIRTEIGGIWYITKRKNAWELINQPINVSAQVSLNPGIAWKLFSSSITPDMMVDKVEISGDEYLAKCALNMLSVMA